MATTIQISIDLQKRLAERKLYEKETYEEVIWDIIEDNEELSEETKNELEKSRAEIRAGKTHSLAHVKKKLGF